MYKRKSFQICLGKPAALMLVFVTQDSSVIMSIKYENFKHGFPDVEV